MDSRVPRALHDLEPERAVVRHVLGLLRLEVGGHAFGVAPREHRLEQRAARAGALEQRVVVEGAGERSDHRVLFAGRATCDVVLEAGHRRRSWHVGATRSPAARLPRSLRAIRPSTQTQSREPPARPAPASADAVEVFDGVEVHLERPRRVRSPSDLLRLLIGGALVALGLVLATVADRTVGGAQADLVDAVSRLPSTLEQAVVGVAQVIAVSVIIVISVVLVIQRRWRRLGVLVLGALIAAGAMKLADRVLDLPETTRAIALHGVRVGWLDDPGFPSSAYLAASAAVVTLASVWMSRQWKRALWGAVVVLGLLRALSSATGALDVVLAIAVGVVVGSLALVVFGAPNRSPDSESLTAALRTVIPGLSAIRQTGGHAESLTYAGRGRRRPDAVRQAPHAR